MTSQAEPRGLLAILTSIAISFAVVFSVLHTCQVILDQAPLMLDRLMARYHNEPFTDTLLFTDAGFSPLTCSASLQARRFMNRRSGRVVVVIVTNDDDWCGYNIANMRKHDIYGFCAPGISENGSDWTMPSWQAEFFYRRLSLTYRYIVSAHTHGSADGVLLLDSDVALFRNIGVRMARAGTDFVFQRELPCHNEPHRRCVNAGVWWISTRSEAVLYVLDHALRLMRELRISDQDALQHALARAHRHVTVTYLAPTSYPNGFVYNYDRRLRARDVHLVHTNWAGRGLLAKLDRLKDLGVVDRYAQCFHPQMHEQLEERGWNSSAARLLPTGFRLPLSFPNTVLWRDLGNALGCADVEDRRCIAARAEPRALAASRLSE